MKTRPAAAAGILLAAALALTGCGSSSSSEKVSLDGKVTGEITFQTWNLKSGFQNYFDGLIDEFEKAHPGTTVKWVDQPADRYADKLQSQVTSGTLPDVVNTDPSLAYPLAQAGALVNLDEADPDAKSDFLPKAWAGTTYRGSVEGTYGYPWYLNTGPNFYNKKLFTQAGLDPAKPPTTYREMLALAVEVGQKLRGRHYLWGSVPSLMDLAQNGVTLMNSDQTKFTFDNDAAAAILEDFAKAYRAGGILPAGLSATYTGVGEAFLNGQIMMNGGSAYDLANFEKNAPDLAANLGIGPAFTTTGSALMNEQDLSLSAKSDNLATAAAFAKFVTNSASQLAFAKVVNIFPSTAGALNDPFFTKYDGTLNTKLRVDSAKQIRTATSYRPPMFTSEMEIYTQQQFADAILGKSSVKDALKNAADKCNQLLAP